MIIVIDDERTFDIDTAANVWYARTSDEGILQIAKAWTNFTLHYGETIEAIYLDHDLGEDDTIVPVVEFLYNLGYTVGKGVYSFTDIVGDIYIHSQNPTAATMIIPLLSPLYSNVQRIPLPELKS